MSIFGNEGIIAPNLGERQRRYIFFVVYVWLSEGWTPRNEAVHGSFSQAPRLVGQLSHSFVLVGLRCFLFGSHVVTHLIVVSALCCQC